MSAAPLPGIDPQIHQLCEEFRRDYRAVQAEVAKAIVGHEEIIDGVLTCLFVGGHALLEGVPGLGKTALIRSLSLALSLKFNRIQFTPDLMPSDITGTTVLDENDQGKREFRFVKGPIFANIVLADEINRTPPKTQAALLESMQERKASIGGTYYPMKNPFFVLATQNPIEQEGTYPLPEAQLDRFLFMIKVDYPTAEEEDRIMRQGTSDAATAVTKVLHGEDILRLQQIVRRVPVGDHVYSFVLDVIRATRPNEPGASDFVRHWLSWGAGPRAGQNMILASKARALMHGRLHVTIEDVEAVAPPVLRHRIIPNFNAEAEGINVEQIIEKVLTLVPRGKGDRLL